MTADGWVTLAVLAVVLVLLVREFVPPVGAVLGGVIALLLTGVLDPAQAFAGFSSPATITIAALFVLARAARTTGALQRALGRVLGDGHGDRRVLARLVAPVVGLSAVVNNTPIVATLAPMVRSWAEAHERPASRFLMPLSFAAILGGTLTAIGTSTTLVVSGQLEQHGLAPFAFFEITPVGLPTALVGGALLVFGARHLLPDRRGPSDDLTGPDRRYPVRMRVVSFGPVDGRSVADAGLRNLAGVFLAQVERTAGRLAPVAPDDVLLGGDVLTFVGEVDQVRDLNGIDGLESAEDDAVTVERANDGHRYYEAVVGPTSPVAGRTLKEIGFRGRYDAAVLGVHRAGERVEGKLGSVRLHAGDVLLVLADAGFGDRWRDARDFLLLGALDPRPPVHPRNAWIVPATLVAVVATAGTGVLPILHAALAAVAVLVVSRVLTVGQARDAVDLDVVLIVAGSLGLGAAVEVSGLASRAADVALSMGSAAGATGALAVVLLATIVLTEVITNTAAAALMVPVALDVAARVGADPRGFAVGVAVAASASFLTPVGYQTNTMVYGVGGYRYTDFWRLGLPITVAVYAVTLTTVRLLWT